MTNSATIRSPYAGRPVFVCAVVCRSIRRQRKSRPARMIAAALALVRIQLLPPPHAPDRKQKQREGDPDCVVGTPTDHILAPHGLRVGDVFMHKPTSLVSPPRG